jgi:hypothetical protein
MKKLLVMLAAGAFLGGCTDVPGPTESFSVGDLASTLNRGIGNPHWVLPQSACDGYNQSPAHTVGCSYQVAGLGNGGPDHPNGWVDGTTEVTARIEFTCINPARKTVKGWTDRQRVGYGTARFEGDRNGTVKGDMDVGLTWTRGNPKTLCPNGNWTITQERPIDVRWTMDAVANGITLATLHGSFAD